jgi:O-acetylserine/cysteine efflux transporter
MKPIDLLAALLLAALWGMGFVFAKAGIGQFPPIFLLAFRFGLAALVMVWFAPLPREEMPRILLISLIAGAVSYSLTFMALRDIDASLGTILIQLEGPLAALLAVVFLKEKITWLRGLGIAIAFIGAVVIAGQPRLEGALWPILLVVGGGVTWASGQVLAKTVSHIGGFRLMTWIAVLVTPQLFIASFIFEDGHMAVLRSADWKGWLIVLYLGLGMTALGYSIWYRLIARYSVNQVSPVLLLVPVIGVIGGMAVLGEQPTLITLVGGAIVIAGVGLSTWVRKSPWRVAGVAPRDLPTA